MTQNAKESLCASTLATLTAGGKDYRYYSLPKLAAELGVDLTRVPVTIRIVLESILRNCDEETIHAESVKKLAGWKANAPREETPFVVSRVILQDLTGVPLLADLAAMRSEAARRGFDPERVEPLVPVDMVVDHSVMIDNFGNPKALTDNMSVEFKRNRERYSFLKWGMQAFKSFGIVPPGFGIVHQVNLEYLARGVFCGKDNTLWPDSVVGTDSHTVMVNGLGVIGWGVGGIEAEAAMLGRPIYMLTPDVVGVHLKGKLPADCTTTDLALTVTQVLRAKKVVGKFVEFFGDGARSLAVPERATIANMAPEYGATMGYFGVDDKTIAFFKETGRTEEVCSRIEAYFKAQGLFGIAEAGVHDYTDTVEIDLAKVRPSLAGPRRPQDRIELTELTPTFEKLLTTPVADGGFSQPADRTHAAGTLADGRKLNHGDIVIAAITSCTNTSNPSVLIAAGLLAKKAVEAGLTTAPRIKTSLAPGSRVVTAYLEKLGLLPYLEKLGFNVAAYGCTTCIGNAGDLAPDILKAVKDENLVTAAVLSGNRNFEARIHPAVKANFLASPALVVAYAIAGSVRRDLAEEPLGTGKDGRPVYLRDIWPAPEEIDAMLPAAQQPEAYRSTYLKIRTEPGSLWQAVTGTTGPCYNWPDSTYIAEPPFMEATDTMGDIKGARALGIFGDSVTTDHISPAGRIGADTPAAKWLRSKGVAEADFNSYGSRRGQHEVMMRGTFANARIKNLMVPANPDGTPVEGGFTLEMPEGKKTTIFEAACDYKAKHIPVVVFAGEEYGTGSSRDWAAKGTKLLGVKAVIVKSFERIHRSNLIGMGVLPLQFKPGTSAQTLGLTGRETFDITGVDAIKPLGDVTLTIHYPDGTVKSVPLTVRIDTPVELTYVKAGGIMPYMISRIENA